MELIKEVLSAHAEEIFSEEDYKQMFEELKFEWALRLELVTHRLRYWRQLAKSCSEEAKPMVLVQIDENEATFKKSLERYDSIRSLSPEQFVEKECEEIGKILKSQLAIAAEDLAKKVEQLNAIRNDSEKFGFLDKVYGEDEPVDTMALEQAIAKAKEVNSQLIDNLADWELLSQEDKAKYVYIKNNSNATFAFADSVVDEFKKSANN